MPNPLPVSYLDLDNLRRRLAYRYSPPFPGKPVIMFLNGFRADMKGDKAHYVETLCLETGVGFLSMDYSGHGLSSGKFEEGTITQWLDDVLDVIDTLVKTPLILVGSSMGGWLALLAALKRPRSIEAIVGIAAGTDFTENLMWDKFTPLQQRQVMEQGYTTIYNEFTATGWPITRRLIESGRQHLLLSQPIALSIPVRLLHGCQDTIVPYANSLKLVELVASSDVTLTLIKAGTHRLNRPEDMGILGTTLKELINKQGI